MLILAFYLPSDPSGWAESSLLRVILDKRDACLGPWIPGRYNIISSIPLMILNFDGDYKDR